jgi:dihydroxyacid dehydratase/phosphogluconate dehydratase
MARPVGSCGMAMQATGTRLSDVLTRESVENALVVHAAFGGSTNLILHLSAVAHAAGLPRPSAADWSAINRQVPRLVDSLPNGPRNHPTVQVFQAGAVPEVMLHLRDAGLLNLKARTVAARQSAIFSIGGKAVSGGRFCDSGWKSSTGFPHRT